MNIRATTFLVLATTAFVTATDITEEIVDVIATTCSVDLYLRMEGVTDGMEYTAKAYQPSDTTCIVASLSDLYGKTYSSSKSKTLECDGDTMCKVKISWDSCNSDGDWGELSPSCIEMAAINDRCDGISTNYCADTLTYELSCGEKYLFVHKDWLLCKAATDENGNYLRSSLDDMPYCADFDSCRAGSQLSALTPTPTNDEYDVDKDSINNRFYVVENDIYTEIDSVEITLDKTNMQDGAIAYVEGPFESRGQYIEYFPPAGFVGHDTISYYITEFGSTDHQTLATVTINVVGVQSVSTPAPTSFPTSAPTPMREAVDDYLQIEQGQTGSIDVASNDLNPGDELTYKSLEDGTNWSFCGSSKSFEGTTLTFVALTDYVGTCIIYYWYKDYNASVGTITIEIVEGRRNLRVGNA